MGLSQEREEHHIWCNNWLGPVEDCKQCKRLYEQCPYDTPEEAENLMKKYFPDNIERK